MNSPSKEHCDQWHIIDTSEVLSYMRSKFELAVQQFVTTKRISNLSIYVYQDEYSDDDNYDPSNDNYSMYINTSNLEALNVIRTEYYIEKTSKPSLDKNLILLIGQ